MWRAGVGYASLSRDGLRAPNSIDSRRAKRRSGPYRSHWEAIYLSVYRSIDLGGKNAISGGQKWFWENGRAVARLGGMGRGGQKRGACFGQ